MVLRLPHNGSVRGVWTPIRLSRVRCVIQLRPRFGAYNDAVLTAFHNGAPMFRAYAPKADESDRS
jgi:hypothetical protein